MDLALPAGGLVLDRAVCSGGRRQRGRSVGRGRRQPRSQQCERGGRPSLGVGRRDLDDERVAGPEVHAVPVGLTGRAERRADRARECRVLEDVCGRRRLVAGLDDRRRVRRGRRRGDEEREAQRPAGPGSGGGCTPRLRAAPAPDGSGDGRSLGPARPASRHRTARTPCPAAGAGAPDPVASEKPPEEPSPWRSMSL